MNRKRTQKRQLQLGILLCFIVIVAFGIIGLNKILNDRQSRRQYDETRDEVIQEQVEDNDNIIMDSEIPFYVDFAKLKAINEDVVGWLYIPSLSISYPIMQGKTNDDYLHRTIEKTYLFAGSIFMDMDNASDFSDPNSIIYGHNMKDGSMFGTLWHIPYQHAADDNPYFWIFTPNKVYKYQIFTAYDTKTDAKTYKLFLNRTIDFRNWCFEMRSWSYIDFGEHMFTENSYVVTLSTCSGTSKVDRTIVQGYRLKEYEYNGYSSGKIQNTSYQTNGQIIELQMNK